MAEETFFTPPTNIKMQGEWGGVVEYGGGDRTMVVMFYNRPKHNPAKSTELGHPYYEDVVYVRIHPPGERLNITDRPATDADKRRFPAQWHQFSQNKEQKPDGAPIDLLYPEHPSVAAMLRACNVVTIEQCAELSAHAIEQIGMGAQQYSNDAKKWLEHANKGASLSQVRHELEARDREIKVLRKTVDDLKGLIEEMRSAAVGQPNLAQMQSMLAGLMQRPQHMPSRSFDSQTAMINATGESLRPVHRAAKRQRPRIAR